MKIKILKTIRGSDVSYEPNDVIDADKSFGESLVLAGAAEILENEILDTVEVKNKKRR